MQPCKCSWKRSFRQVRGRLNYGLNLSIFRQHTQWGAHSPQVDETGPRLSQLLDSHSSLRELTINARILYHLVLSLWPGLVIQLSNWLADDLGLWSRPSGDATAIPGSPIHYQQPSHRHRNAVSRLNNAGIYSSQVFNSTNKWREKKLQNER